MLATLLTVAVIVGGITRLYFGVDFTDESYYAALSYRFALGDTPYIAELNIRQNAAILTWPAVELWLGVTGGASGLVLFLRYIYIAVRLALVVLAARTFWRRTSAPVALIASLVPCAYVFLLIPALSYNTLAGSCVTAALCGFLLWRETGKMRYSILMMAMSSIAAFVHPAVLAVSIAICATALWRAEAGERRRLWKLSAILLAAWFVVLAIVAISLGRENIEHLFRTAGAFSGPAAGLSTIIAMGPRLLQLSHGGVLLVVLWGSLWFLRVTPSWLRVVHVAAYAALVAIADNQAVMVWLALGSIPVCWSGRDGEKEDLTMAAALSVAAGVSIGAFSTNGAMNAAVGAEVAVMAFIVGTMRVVPHGRPLLPALLAATIVVRLALSQWAAVYRDDRIIKLSVTVPNGPFRGLKTSAQKWRYLDALQRALDTASRGKSSLVAFNGIPAAHLMVDVPPALPSTWVPDYPLAWAIQLRKALANSLAGARRPILVLQLKHLYRGAHDDEQFSYSDSDAFMRALEALRPTPLLDTPDFRLYEISQEE